MGPHIQWTRRLEGRLGPLRSLSALALKEELS